jgi:Mitochondrial glycoprotein.
MSCQSVWLHLTGDLKVSALHNSPFYHYIAYSFNKHLSFQCLYDLLMNLLEERGISNEFVEKLSDFSTAYEHSLYIALLENTKKFVSGK